MTNYHKTAKFDKQGNYFWSLTMQAGWNRVRIANFLIQHYQKSHWNLLDPDEKKGSIAMLKNYVAKEIVKREKKLRQTIYAIWFKNGYQKEELNDLMNIWGYGDSLRKCEMESLNQIYKNVIKIVKPKKEITCQNQKTTNHKN